MIFDIVYSLLAHDEPDALNDTISNIKKYNRNNKIIICVHLNNDMYNKFKLSKNNEENVFINPKHYNKKTFTMSLLAGHIDNFNYVKNKDITFKSFMFLASNCHFCKQVQPIDNFVFPQLIDDNKLKTINRKENIVGHLNIMMKNKNMVKILRNDNVKLFKYQIEGALLTYELMNKIVKYIENNKLLNLVTHETCFEELLLPSLEIYYQGKVSERCCKVFWGLPGYRPQKRHVDGFVISDDNKYCVKRVHRKVNDPIRKYINCLRGDRGLVFEQENYFKGNEFILFNEVSTLFCKNRVLVFKKNVVDSCNFCWFGMRFKKNDNKNVKKITFEYKVNYNKKLEKVSEDIGMKVHTDRIINNPMIIDDCENGKWCGYNWDANLTNGTLFLFIFGGIYGMFKITVKNVIME